MDGELWEQLYSWIELVDNAHAQDPRKRHRDAAVVAAVEFAVLHDRPAGQRGLRRAQLARRPRGEPPAPPAPAAQPADAQPAAGPRPGRAAVPRRAGRGAGV